MGAIESPTNPLIRQIVRSLDERTHLLLEGEKSILDAVSAGTSLAHVLHDESVRPGRLAMLTSTRPRLVSRAVLERLADSHTPQHVIAVAKRRDVPTAEILARPGPVVFVFGIQDPGNLGAIVRVAVAAGAAGVVGAPGTADFFHPRAVRGSAGSVLRLPVSGRVSFEAFAVSAREDGRTICGAVSEGGENPFADPPPERSVLVIGAEGTGLPAGAYRYLDRRLSIPMRPPVDSLNAAVATALLLYSRSISRDREATRDPSLPSG
jgi:TrmH family RNA methyltransferase